MTAGSLWARQSRPTAFAGVDMRNTRCTVSGTRPKPRSETQSALVAPPVCPIGL